MLTTNGTYVYCVVKSPRKPSLTRVPPGVPGGGRPRALPGPTGTWLIVSDVPLTEYGGGSIDLHLRDLEWVSARAMAHEAVVEFCARKDDVIPMKLFTIFRADARAVESVGGARALSAAFRRIAGCAEWSVRVSCAPVTGNERAHGARVAALVESGTAFLQRKKSQRDDRRQAAAEARRAVDTVFERLDRIAKDAVRKDTDTPGSRLVLDAAFLVSRSRQATFERECARLARSTSGSGCELVLSGPWPAYHFVGSD